MGLWICSLVCHKYLKDVLSFSYVCILQGKTKNLCIVDALTPSHWTRPLVLTMLQPLVMFRALSFCHLSTCSWKVFCSYDFVVLIKTRPCGVTGEGEEKRLFWWESRALETAERRRKLSQTLQSGHYRSCLVNLHSLLYCTTIPSYVPQGAEWFLAALRNFWCTT